VNGVISATTRALGSLAANEEFGRINDLLNGINY